MYWGTQEPSFIPVHLLPPYHWHFTRKHRADNDFSVQRRVTSLPMSSAMFSQAVLRRHCRKKQQKRKKGLANESQGGSQAIDNTMWMGNERMTGVAKKLWNQWAKWNGRDNFVRVARQTKSFSSFYIVSFFDSPRSFLCRFSSWFGRAWTLESPRKENAKLAGQKHIKLNGSVIELGVCSSESLDRRRIPFIVTESIEVQARHDGVVRAANVGRDYQKTDDEGKLSGE